MENGGFENAVGESLTHCLQVSQGPRGVTIEVTLSFELGNGILRSVLSLYDVYIHGRASSVLIFVEARHEILDTIRWVVNGSFGDFQRRITGAKLQVTSHNKTLIVDLR